MKKTSLKTLRSKCELLKSKGLKPRTGKVFKCKTCGKYCYFKPYQAKKYKNHYCSRECQHIGISIGAKEKRKCLYCGKEYFVYSSYVKYRISNYCSNRCKWLDLSTRYIGEKSSNWKGGYENKIYHNKLRRIREIGASGNHTLQQWLDLKKKHNYTCPCCGKKEPEIKLSEDHIIPLIVGGSDNIDNIQPLCRSCNSKKGSRKIIKYNIYVA